MSDSNWYLLPLEQLDTTQWELLCDRCGRCCVHKLINDETDELFFTRVSCRLLDTEKICCSDYENRLARVQGCIQVSLTKPEVFDWLPSTCAYRLRYEGKPLYSWHPLISGDNNAMIDAGVLLSGGLISEDTVNQADLEDYIVSWK